MRLIDADTIFNNELLLVRTECYDAVHAVIERINNAPTVDPVKHGHWVEQEHEDWKWSKEYRCSECGQYRLVTTPVGREWNYCPHCGAKMEVSEWLGE